MSDNKIKVLGIHIYDGTIHTAISRINLSVGARKNLLVSATGAHGIIEAIKNPIFKDILNLFHLNLPDGQPNVWIAKLKGAKKINHCYGPDFFREFLSLSADNSKIRHFFCGGISGVAVELQKAIESKFNNSNVVGTHCPPFLDVEKYDYRQIAELIKNSNANIIWIGLSTPKQEQFAYLLSEFTKVDAIICVGAAFDFHTDRVKQAPKFIQQVGLEWFFRLLMEPRRLFKRYVEIVPKFIVYNILDLLKLKSF